MCMNCGCGQVDTRHQPTDLVRKDLQRAADANGMDLTEAARNVAHAAQQMADGKGTEPEMAGTPAGSPSRRA